MPGELTSQISNEVAAAAKEFGGLPEAKQLRFENAADIPLAMSLGERLMASIKAQYDNVPKESRAAYEASLSNYQRGLLYCAEIGDGKHLNPNFANAFGEPKTQATPTAPETPAVPRPMPLFLDASGNLQYGVPGTTDPDKALFRVSAVMALGYVAQDAKGNGVPGYCFAMENKNGDKKMVHVDARTLSQLALMHCLSNEKVIDDAAIATNKITPEQGALVRVMRKKAEGAKIAVDPGELKKIEDSTPMIKDLDKKAIENKRDNIKIQSPTDIDAAAKAISTVPAEQDAEKKRLEAVAADAKNKKDAIDALVKVYQEKPSTAQLAEMFKALWKYHESGIDGEIAAQEAQITAIDAKLAATGITEADKTKLTSDKSKLEEKVALIKKEKATGFSGASTLIARMMQEGNLSPETVKAVKDMLEAQPSDTKAFMDVMKRAGDEAAQVEMDRVLTVNKLDSEEVQEEKKGWSKLGKFLLAGGGTLALLLALSVYEAASGGNGGRGMDDIMRMVTMLMGGQGGHDMSPEEHRKWEEWIRAERRGEHRKPPAQAPQAQAKGHA